MRIIGGKFKGRRLEHFNAQHIRPTTDRVKESLFNILQFQIDGARVLDLFAGTGNLGIEALSRGAKEVISVELNPKSISIIKKNLQSLKIDSGIEVIKKDAFQYLKQNKDQSFDIIFIDPPFTEVLGDKVMQALSQTECVAPEAVVAIETASKEPIQDEYENLKLQDRRFYGDKVLSLYSRAH